MANLKQTPGSTPVFVSIHGDRFGISAGDPGNAGLVLDGYPVAATATGPLTQTSASSALTALAGGGNSSLTPVLASNNNLASVVATTSDSFQLPKSFPGAEITVLNEGAASAAIFPFYTSSDIINALTSGVSLPVGSSRVATFVCNVAGKWRSYTSATS